MDFFNRICHSRTQINNEILNEIEMQELRKPVTGKIVYNIFHSRTQIINEIVNDIEIHRAGDPISGLGEGGGEVRKVC